MTAKRSRQVPDRLRVFSAGRAEAALLFCLALISCTERDRAEKGTARPDLVFKLALQPNAANKVWEGANLVKEYLERESNGRIKVKFYDSAVLGNEIELLEDCHRGQIEMVQATSSKVTNLDPTFGILDLPYVFISDEHHKAVLHGSIGRDMLNGLREYNMQGLAFFDCGWRNIFTKRVAVRKPEDLAGLKIRVMPSPAMVAALNRMGASATPLSATELFQSIKTGVVDGAENNPNVFMSEKFYEAGCNHYCLTQHFSNQHFLVVNLEWLEGVKQNHPDLHELILKAPAAIMEEYDKRWGAAVAKAMDEMESVGVTIVRDVNKKAFMEEVQPVVEEFFKRYSQVDRGYLTRIRREASLE